MGKITMFIKKRWGYCLIGLLAFFLGTGAGASGLPTQESYDKLDKKVGSLEANNKELTEENKKLEEKVEEAAPYFAMAEQERKNKEAEAKAKAEELKKKEEAEKAKKEAEEKAKAEAAAKKAEEEERKGYDTGITYDQLARTPDDYIVKKVKFRGKVVQVMEGDGFTQVRLAVNDDYDTILYAEFKSSIVDSRVLEDDVITIMGVSSGLITYESTMGGNISIPSVMVEKIER